MRAGPNTGGASREHFPLDSRLSISAVTHRHSRWSSTAPHSDIATRRFRVIHPFHPLFQHEFDLITYRQDWGDDRVWFADAEGRLHSLPTTWTDVVAVDPFVAVAAGRSRLRVAELLELARWIANWTPGGAGQSVKEKTS
jgi:hypothetical protein